MAGRLLDTFSEKQEKRPRRFNSTRRVIERLLEISQISSEQMRNAFSKILLILLVGQVSFGLSFAQAGPLDFFRRIRDSFAHPRHHQRTVIKTQSKGDNGTTVKRNDVRPPELKKTGNNGDAGTRDYSNRVRCARATDANRSPLWTSGAK